MGIFDWFKKAPGVPVGEDREPPPATVGEGQGIGELRRDKKHGRWKERGKWGFWTALDYVDGVKQGDYVEWKPEGPKHLEGTFVDGLRSGVERMFDKEGRKRLEGSYVADKQHGTWTWWHEDGSLSSTGSYERGVRTGEWVVRAQAGTSERGAYDRDEKRDGAWTTFAADGTTVIGRGTYAHGKREGGWTTFAADGKTIVERGTYVADQREGEWVHARAPALVGATAVGAGPTSAVGTIDDGERGRGSYTANKREGAWELHHPDGTLAARGSYSAGEPSGAWELFAVDGTSRGVYACAGEGALAKWEIHLVAIDLLANYAPTREWIERVTTAFPELRGPSKVQAKTDAVGQRWLSAPLDAYWQMRIAAGEPIDGVLRELCWEKVLAPIEPLANEAAGPHVEHVVARCGRHPGYGGRELLTSIVDGDTVDPRAQLYARFEPGRTLSRAQLQRFAERVPHAKVLRLRECTFPDGLVPLFERGFPELEILYITRSELEPGACNELLELLGKAPWVGALARFAIKDPDEILADDRIASFLANPALRLTALTLHAANLGAATAKVLRASSITEISISEATLDVAAIQALACMAALEELELEACELPDMTTRDALACGPAPRLKRLSLSQTLGIEKYATDNERSAYAVARRLAVMPVLATVEELDLSHNEIDDELAIRVLARSPHLGALRTLDFDGNDAELDELRDAYPAIALDDKPRPSNVVHIQL
ncbi:MAG: hypothetical protein QM831_04680 [Kofleriaceae bacterium]